MEYVEYITHTIEHYLEHMKRWFRKRLSPIVKILQGEGRKSHGINIYFDLPLKSTKIG